MHYEPRIRPEQFMDSDWLSTGVLVGTGAAVVFSLFFPLLRVLIH